MLHNAKLLINAFLVRKRNRNFNSCMVRISVKNDTDKILRLSEENILTVLL